MSVRDININNKWIGINDLLESNNLYSLCISFFNLAEDNDNFFIIESYYKNSKFSNMELTKELLIENNYLLSNVSGLPFILEKNKHRCYIKKTKDLTASSFFEKIYKKIQLNRAEYDDEQFSEAICSSLFFLRGSIDFNHNFFSVDIYRKYQDQNYLNMIFYLLTSIGDLKQLNFNFREFQNQHIKNINKRNTQIRINLKWIYNNLFQNLKKFNKYKFNILDNNFELINSKKIVDKISLDFYSRIQFYIKNILNSKVSDLDINSLRKEIGFNNDVKNVYRNSTIVNLAKYLLPDFCSGCVFKYNLSERTFKYKNSCRWYLEINHVISFANNNVDQINNLCKLCPTCHRALTPNRADEMLQKEIIKSIIENNPMVSEYVGLFVKNTNSLQQKIDYVFMKLR